MRFTWTPEIFLSRFFSLRGLVLFRGRDRSGRPKSCDLPSATRPCQMQQADFCFSFSLFKVFFHVFWGNKEFHDPYGILMYFADVEILLWQFRGGSRHLPLVHLRSAGVDPVESHPSRLRHVSWSKTSECSPGYKNWTILGSNKLWHIQIWFRFNLFQPQYVHVHGYTYVCILAMFLYHI